MIPRRAVRIARKGLAGTAGRLLVVVVVVAIVAAWSPHARAQCAGAEVPVFVQTAVQPNILIAYDTSASMKEPIDASWFFGYSGWSDYTTAMADYLATLDGDDCLNLHLGGVPFEKNAVYDAYEAKICDHYSDCAETSSWQETSLSWSGWAGPDDGGLSWYDVDAAYIGNYLNYLHSNRVRDAVAREAIKDIVSNLSGMRVGLMGFTPYLADGNTADLGGELIAPIDLDPAGVITALTDYSETTGLIANGFGHTPLALQVKDGARYFKGEYTDENGQLVASPSRTFSFS